MDFVEDKAQGTEKEEREEIEEEEEEEEEEIEDEQAPEEKGVKNSALAVGYRHDRSFVVRGSQIGVFQHTPDNRLKFSTTIRNVRTPSGQRFQPRKYECLGLIFCRCTHTTLYTDYCSTMRTTTCSCCIQAKRTKFTKWI